MARAKHISYHVHTERPLAIYPEGTPLEELDAIAEQLNRIPGVESYATTVEPDDGTTVGPAMPVVWMGVRMGFPVERAMAKLVELTQPELRYTLADFSLHIYAFACGQHCRGTGPGVFLPSLIPDDLNEYFEKVYNGLNDLKVLKGSAPKGKAQLERRLAEIEQAVRDLLVQSDTYLVNFTLNVRWGQDCPVCSSKASFN